MSVIDLFIKARRYAFVEFWILEPYQYNILHKTLNHRGCCQTCHSCEIRYLKPESRHSYEMCRTLLNPMITPCVDFTAETLERGSKYS